MEKVKKIKRFVHFNETWYRESCMGGKHPSFHDQIHVGINSNICPEELPDFITGEFVITFYDFKKHGISESYCIEIFSDMVGLWRTPEIQEFFNRLETDVKYSPQDMIKILLDLGFVDETEREDPDPNRFGERKVETING